jgi:2'-hydroxyisoflavone reductase
MHLLVLGGTRFVGRAVVDAALSAGHQVTLFNRGRTDAGLYPQLETVIGDRTGDLSELRGRQFDTVVDVAGYHPEVVANAARAFAGSRYVYVSSVSVYADQSVPPVEGAATLADDTYGGRKAACEEAVRLVHGDGALIARPGLIVGPHDPTERFPYWPRRLARGGRVLAPGDPGDPMQFVDVRDLGRWLVGTGASGTFNVVGVPLPMADFLEICRTEEPAELVWVSAERLIAAGVDPDMGVPMWIGDPTWKAANLVDGSRARAAGFVTRPVAETVADTRAWDVARGGAAPGTDPLTPEQECAILGAA